MTKACVLALLALAATRAHAAPGTSYRHTGNTELHVAAGISVSLVAGSLHMLSSDDRRAAAVTGAAAALGAGIAKEIADTLGFGTPSLRDALLTAAGGIAGALALYQLAGQIDTISGRRTLAHGSTLSGLTFSVPVVRELFRRITRS